MGRKQRLGFHTDAIWFPDEVGWQFWYTFLQNKVLHQENIISIHDNHQKIICQKGYMVSITPKIMIVDVFTHDWVQPKGIYLAKKNPIQKAWLGSFRKNIILHSESERVYQICVKTIEQHDNIRQNSRNLGSFITTSHPVGNGIGKNSSKPI